MYHRGYFREDILNKYVLCETENNSIKYIINQCKELKEIKKD
jgi:hypothetical protein